MARCTILFLAFALLHLLVVGAVHDFLFRNTVRTRVDDVEFTVRLSPVPFLQLLQNQPSWHVTYCFPFFLIFFSVQSEPTPDPVQYVPIGDENGNEEVVRKTMSSTWHVNIFCNLFSLTSLLSLLIFLSRETGTSTTRSISWAVGRRNVMVRSVPKWHPLPVPSHTTGCAWSTSVPLPGNWELRIELHSGCWWWRQHWPQQPQVHSYAVVGLSLLIILNHCMIVSITGDLFKERTNGTAPTQTLCPFNIRACWLIHLLGNARLH